MLVYRDTSRERCSLQLQTELLAVLQRSECGPTHEDALEALLRAGELECGLWDLSPHDMPACLATELTDLLARGYLAGRDTRAEARQLLAAMRVQQQLPVREPEGYAYYALDPRSYAECVTRAKFDAPAMAVIGVRSIGASLSAVVAAALNTRGMAVERTTVRPSGHPWARELVLDQKLHDWLRRAIARSSHFLVVDEGPGLSGSTFVAVARALEATGVPASQITLVCSHIPNPDGFTSEQARLHFRRYDVLAPEPAIAPSDGAHDLSGGAWRRWVFGEDRDRWPASWARLERVKQLDASGRWLSKFEGYPPYCQPAAMRARTLADAGLAPSVEYAGKGRLRFPWLAGRPGESADLQRGLLDRLMEYCAFRAHAFAASQVDPSALNEMLEVNVREACGLSLDGRVALELESAVIPDARMQPHEWVVTTHGHYYKLDGHGDGCGHLLPGPCDVCWDLAGAIVEWRMSDAQSASFVHGFEQRTRQRVQNRLPNYLIAYCAFRVGALSLARLSADADEVQRIERARVQYHDQLERMLREHGLLT